MTPENIAEGFGARLKALRIKAGLTQPELAERSGLAKAGIANLEQGRTQPAWETVVRLCRALGVACDAFMQAPAEDASAAGRGRPRKEGAGERKGGGEPAADAPVPAKRKRKSRKR